MKPAARFVSIALVCAALCGPARAQDDAVHTILSPEDVRLYGEIFRAENAGQTAKSDAAIAKLEDKSLVGYVLEARYIGPHHRAQFSELRSWLETYGDLADADKIYGLAKKRAPKKTRVPSPSPIHWRGAKGEGDQFDETTMQTALARQTFGRMRSFAREEKPEAAEALLKKTVASRALPQADQDRLAAYAAAQYFSAGNDERALSLAEETLRHGPAVSPQCHWTAGLAAFRLGQFENAAHHFEAVSQINDTSPVMTSGGAFWAARSWTRAGNPERVLALYGRAAAQPENFYGLLAARLMGREIAPDLKEPLLDTVSFAELMQNKAAHRAVALWQIGHRDQVPGELARAFGDIDPDQDPAFAALARHLEAPSLELRAAETSAARDVKLSSLYPVPPYKPKGGYTVDQALVLGFARQESRFETEALSRSGARGVMQIMPATAAILARDRSLARANRKKLDDPEYSMTLGQQYLGELLERQNGHLFELAAAYNAGAGNLDKWLTAQMGAGDPLMFVESIPIPETRDYIKRVMANVWMYRKRLGEPADGIDEAAAGAWPVYKKAGTVAVR